MVRLSIATWPDHLLTLDEWDALPEDTVQRFELVEGILLVAPKPTPLHQWAMVRLCAQLDAQLPDELKALADVEVLVEAGFPPTVRAPDIVVIPTAVARRNPARLDAADVLLAVEIVSPGSRRTDRVTKPAEYADAGIRHYWVIELDPPVTLTGHLLVEGGYEETIRTTDRVDVVEPAPLSFDLATLLARR
jgi:Uma2 family endonuclease